MEQNQQDTQQQAEQGELELPMQSADISASYTEEDIKSLGSLEHIQLRPGMYIGRLGKGTHEADGIYVLLKEVIDNSIDEFTAGYCKTIDVTIDETGLATIRDYGRGIPLDKVVDCVSKMNTSGKFVTGKDGKPAPFACSIGLNGVGLKAVNALSESFTVISRRDGKSMTAVFSDGKEVSHKKGTCKNEPNGTEISFRPGQKYFPEFQFDVKNIVPRKMRNYAWLNTGLVINFNGTRFSSRRGILDLLDSKIGEDAETVYSPIHYRSGNLENLPIASVEFAFTHTNSFDENYFSFVNGQYTNDGGTHLSAFKEGILKAVKEISQKEMEANDVRNGIIGVISVKVKDPVFESQTKHKLGNTDIRVPIVDEVSKAVLEVLYKQTEIKEALLEKIEKNNEVRTKVAAVKKEAKEQARKTALRIPKLKDCRFHLCDAENKRKPEDKERCAESMLFLTEGDSAASNLIKARDPETQAVFPLRGKPLNCFGKGKEMIYKNEELYFVTQALGIENSLDDLRYSKIVIASDADVDGFHIRLLVITFFLTLFEPLVLSDHLFILETPLYRVRDPRQKKRRSKTKAKPGDSTKKGAKAKPEEENLNFYCYNDQERDEAVKKIGKNAEITRFKGLGEISPEEFKDFIAKDTMRLLPVSVDDLKDVSSILKFYMGGNTPNRRDYILKHLLSDITI